MKDDDLYVIQMAVTGDFKVGRSCDVARRLGQLQTGSPHTLRILIVGKGLGHTERIVHSALHGYKTSHRRTEWFREEGMGSIPTHLWEMMDPEMLENPDWWKAYQ